MKFLVPNYSCLHNPWLGGYRPQIPVLSILCPQLNLLNPPLPPEKNSWVRHCPKRWYFPTKVHCHRTPDDCHLLTYWNVSFTPHELRNTRFPAVIIARQLVCIKYLHKHQTCRESLRAVHFSTTLVSNTFSGLRTGQAPGAQKSTQMCIEVPVTFVWLYPGL